MTGHCSICGDTGGCYCSEMQLPKNFWQSVDNDQEIGPCLVTDGDKISYAFFNGDIYLETNFRQKDIIAWYKIENPPLPEELLSPEQSALLQLDKEIEELKRNLEILKSSVAPVIEKYWKNEFE